MLCSLISLLPLLTARDLTAANNCCKVGADKENTSSESESESDLPLLGRASCLLKLDGNVTSVSAFSFASAIIIKGDLVFGVGVPKVLPTYLIWGLFVIISIVNVVSAINKKTTVQTI